MAKIPSCHIDEPFTEDIEARYEYRSQMDLKATQFKLSVARQCKKYVQACDRVNQRKRHSLQPRQPSQDSSPNSDILPSTMKKGRSITFYKARDF